MTAKRSSILLADDDPEDRELFISRIRQNNLDVDVLCFSNGQDALVYLQNCGSEILPSLLLIDYQMPVLSGHELLEILALDPRFRQIRKFIWSTMSYGEYVDRCVACGAEKYYVKPGTAGEFNLMVDEIARALTAKS